jgi:hypothetical protein
MARSGYAAALVACLAVAAPARGDELAPPAPEPAATAEPVAEHDAVGLTQVMDVARARAEDGLRLFSEGKWKEAYARFEVADRLFHAPTLVMFMGHCKRELGDLVLARDLYKRVVGEEMVDEAPPAYFQAVETARVELEKVDARIPRISIAVSGVAPQDVRASLDARPTNLHPFRLGVNPGEHVVEVLGRRADPVRKRVTVVEGQTLKVDVTLTPVSEATPPPIGLAWPIVFGAIGVAGLSLGAITGAVVLSEVSDLEQRCGGFTCPTDVRPEHADVAPIATVSTVAFVAGGIAAATSVVLLTLHLTGGDDGTRIDTGVGSLTLTQRF